MSAHFIPSASAHDKMVEKMRLRVTETLRPHLKKKSLEEGVSAAMAIIAPLLGSNKPALGATVMTENAAMNNKAAKSL